MSANHTPMITSPDNLNHFVANTTSKLALEINEDLMITNMPFQNEGRDLVNKVSTIFNDVLNSTFKGMI